MGILTGTATVTNSNFNRTFQRISKPLAVFLYFGGICYFALMLWPSFIHETYISEHALLPGVADEQFNKEHFMNAKLQDLKNVIGSRLKKNVLVDFWLKEFTDMRLEAYAQNFTVRFPLQISKRLSGTNVYGIVRAPRGSANEAIVIAVPNQPDMVPAFAVMLAVASYARDQIYWAKDLIFVVADHREIGMRAWLNAYHGKENSDYVMADELQTHSGPIQAAICLELNTDRITQAEIAYNMINGQLPNLDFFNVAVRLAAKFGISPTIFGRQELWNYYSNYGYAQLLSTASSGILRQAVGAASGLHSVFGSFNVEAITIKPLSSSSQENHHDLSVVAKVMEGILRSVNNLLERFHQSFFFYLLLSTHRYMSIGVYMPAIGAMLLAPLMISCALWMSMNADDEKSEEDDVADINVSEIKFDEWKKTGMTKSAHSLTAVVPYFIASHVFGLLIRLVPDYGQTLLSLVGVSVCPSEYFSVMIVVAIGYMLIFPKVMEKLGRIYNEDKVPSAVLFRCVCLLELAVVVGVISILNFGLGFVLCLAWVPIFSLITPSKNWLIRIVNTILLIATNPLVLFFIGHLVVMPPADGELDLGYVLKMISMTKKTFVTMMVENYLYDSWLFTIMTVVLLPIWIQFWALVHFPQ